MMTTTTTSVRLSVSAKPSSTFGATKAVSMRRGAAKRAAGRGVDDNVKSNDDVSSSSLMDAGLD